MTLIKDISFAFNNIFGKNKLSTIFLGTCICLLAYSIIINPININLLAEKVVEGTHKETERKHKNSLKERDNLNEIVPMWMENQLYKFNSDAVFLLELHNNGNNIEGLPFKKFTCTIEIINFQKETGNKEYITPFLENQSLGSYYKTFQAIKNGEPLLITTNGDKRNVVSPITYLMQKFELKSLYLLPIIGTEGDIIMILCICYSEKYDLPDDVIKSLQKQFYSVLKKGSETII